MKLFLIIFFLFLLPTGSHAAEPEKEETLKPVLVTATRLKDVEEEASKIPNKVVVITKDDIERSGAKTVQEALQYQTGIVLYDQIGNEFQSTVDLRGFNGQPVPATTVFVDGVRVNEPDFNQVNFDFIPIEDVEKIEILYGPGTVYGRNSLGGVINITMKRGSKDKLSVSGEAGGGSYFRQKYSFAADIPLPLPNFNHYFSATRELSDGYRQDADGRITRIFNKLGYFNDSGTDVTLSYTHVTDLLKQAGSLTQAQLDRHRRDNATPGDFKDSTYNLVTLNLRQKLPAGFSMALNSFYRDNDTESFVVGLTSVSDAFNDYQQWGGTLQFSNDRVLSERNSFNLGVEYGNNHFTNDTTGSFSGFPFAARTSTHEDVVGFYFLDTLDIFESLSVTGGFRYDWDRIDLTDRITPAFSFVKTFDHFSPRAGVVYNPLPTLGFYFNYSQGFRTPTVQEFPAFDPPNFAPVIADLDPVRSQNFEVGVRGRLAHWLDGSVVFFYTPVKDEILFVVIDPATFSGRNVNISDSLRRGVEITINGRYGKRLNGFLNYTYTKATFETDVLLFSGQVRKGDEFPLVPNHRVSFGVNFLPTEGLTASLFGLYVGSQFLANDEPNDFKKLDDYFVLNGKVSYSWKNFTAHITGSNLTNNKFETFGIVGGFPAQPFLVPFPTTTVFAGIKFRYNKQ
jgi:iron complex outermembrane receptor protein